MLTPNQRPRGLSVEFLLMCVLCAGWVIWFLSLPLFPSQDGPVHLYYAHVMQALFSKQPTIYSHFYTIKHILPPYAIYYYALIFLGRFVPLVTADKIVICCYVVSFLFGFRYLAQTIGPCADSMALMATLVVINWPLGMGCVTFCGSLSLALWCLGLYARAAERSDTRRKVLFVLLAWLVMLAHPVPLLTVIGYCVLDIATRGYTLRSARRASLSTEAAVVLKQDAVYVLLAMSSLLYVRLFATAHPLQQIAETEPFLRQVSHNLILYVKGRGITPFGGMVGVALAARLCLLATLPLSLGLAVLQRDRHYPVFTVGRRWLFLTLALLLAMPFVPHDINASHYVADRMLLFLWVAALLAGSAFRGRAWSLRLALMLFAVAGNVFILRAAEVYIRPAANELAAIERGPLTHKGQVGLLIDSDWSVEPSKNGPLFNSYGWAGASYFRLNNAVLYNTPWLDLNNIPLGAQWTLPTGTISSSTLEDPDGLRTELLSSPHERESVFRDVSFVFVNRTRGRSVNANPLAVGSGKVPLLIQADPGAWYTVWDVKQPTSP